MAMTLQGFDDWLDAYGRAWESRNPQARADLYAEDGNLPGHAVLEPMARKASHPRY